MPRGVSEVRLDCLPVRTFNRVWKANTDESQDCRYYRRRAARALRRSRDGHRRRILRGRRRRVDLHYWWCRLGFQRRPRSREPISTLAVQVSEADQGRIKSRSTSLNRCKPKKMGKPLRGRVLCLWHRAGCASRPMRVAPALAASISRARARLGSNSVYRNVPLLRTTGRKREGEASGHQKSERNSRPGCTGLRGRERLSPVP